MQLYGVCSKFFHVETDIFAKKELSPSLPHPVFIFIRVAQHW